MQDITEMTKPEDIVNFTHTVFDQFSRNRATWDIQSRENHRFKDGDHYNFRSTSSGGASNPTKMGRKVMLSTCLLENKRNMVLQSDPKPVVSEKVDPKDLKNAQLIATATQNALSEILDYEDFTYKMGDVVMNAMIDNVAYFELFNDHDGIHIGTKEFRDVYIPVGLKDLAASPIIGKKFKGIKGNYRGNDDYMNIDKLKSSSLEDAVLNTKRTQDDYKYYEYSLDDLNTFEGVEWEAVFRLTEKSIKKLKNKCKWIKDKEPGDKIMRLFTVSGDTLIRDTYLDVDRYYLYAYNALGGPLYQPSLFRRLISLNQAYNNIWSLIEEYIAFAVKYRLLLPRGEVVSQITNRDGAQIYYENELPKELGHTPVDPALFNILNKYEQTMQTIMNISDSSQGVMASGEKKFKAMETQKQQDMFNTKPLIDNLRITLKQMTKGILDLIDGSYDLRPLVYQNGSEINTIQIVGNKYAKEHPTKMDAEDKENLVIIKKDYPVDIKIASGLDYTENSVRNMVMQLVTTEMPQNPLIPNPTGVIKEVWADELGPIMDKAQREQEQQQKDNLQPQMQSPQNALPPAPPQAAPQPSLPPQMPQGLPQGIPQAGNVSPVHELHGNIMRNIQDILTNHTPAKEVAKPVKATKTKAKRTLKTAKGK